MKTFKKINLSKKDIKKLEKIHSNINNNYYLPDIQIPCDVLMAYNEWDSIEEVVEFSGVCKKTVYNVLNRYKNDKDFILKQKRVSPYFIFDNDITIYFKYHPIKTYKEATDTIISITNIKRSKTQIYDFLVKANYKKNEKGFITKNGERNIKQRNVNQKNMNQRKKQEITDDRYLYDHIKEIAEFYENNPANTFSISVNMIKKQFPKIKQEKEEIKKALKDYLKYIYN